MAKQKAGTSKLKPKEIAQRFDALKGARSTWESHWTELANYILPNRNDITSTTTGGNKRNPALLDNTAMMSNELLAGFIHGVLTNPNAQWFELTSGDAELDNLDGIRRWLQKTTMQVHNVINNSNFQTEAHPFYLDLSCFGTSSMAIAEDEESVVRFATKHIKEIYIEENSRGQIDELYREFSWNIRQIVGEFGMDVLKGNDKLMKMWKDGSVEKLCIIHAVYPRDVTVIDSPQRFCSHYILKDRDSAELSFGYFREFPFVVSRWTKAAGEVYGRSPGMNALPDTKTINKMTETILIGAQKAVDPPIQAPDDTFVLPLRTRPGGINYYRSGTNDRLEPIYNNANIDFGFQAMADRGKRIREAFFVDQLQLSQGPQMTATEVLQRTEEKMRLLGPMLGRQQSEFLRPLIERVFEIMSRRNMIEYNADIMKIFESRGIKKLDVQYSSMIAKAQRVQEGQNIERTMQAMAPFIAMDPAIKDNFDGDVGARVVAKIFGFPQEILRDVKARDDMRAAQAKAQQEALKQQEETHQANLAQKVMPGMAKLQTLSQEQQTVNG